MVSMDSYSKAAMDRAMKVQEVILRAMAKKITWWQAAEIIGISDRQMRRGRERYEEFGVLIPAALSGPLLTYLNRSRSHLLYELLGCVAITAAGATGAMAAGERGAAHLPPAGDQALPHTRTRFIRVQTMPRFVLSKCSGA